MTSNNTNYYQLPVITDTSTSTSGSMPVCDTNSVLVDGRCQKLNTFFAISPIQDCPQNTLRFTSKHLHYCVIPQKGIEKNKCSSNEVKYESKCYSNTGFFKKNVDNCPLNSTENNGICINNINNLPPPDSNSCPYIIINKSPPQDMDNIKLCAKNGALFNYADTKKNTCPDNSILLKQNLTYSQNPQDIKICVVNKQN